MLLTSLLPSVGAQDPPIAFRNQSVFGAGTGPIFLDNIDCQGTEDTLLPNGDDGCHLFSSIGVHSCDHTQDAGVRCPGNLGENVSAAVYVIIFRKFVCIIVDNIQIRVAPITGIGVSIGAYTRSIYMIEVYIPSAPILG